MASVASQLQLLGRCDYVVGAEGRGGAARWVVESPRIEARNLEQAGEVDSVVVFRHLDACLQVGLVGVAEQMWPASSTSVVIARYVAKGWKIRE